MSRTGLAVPTTLIALALSAAITAPAQGTARERTCFYYSNSGWGLWATRNVSCRTARRVYNDAMGRIHGSPFHRTIHVDGYRCKMHFDGGGNGSCSASRHRRISFSVP